MWYSTFDGLRKGEDNFYSHKITEIEYGVAQRLNIKWKYIIVIEDMTEIISTQMIAHFVIHLYLRGSEYMFKWIYNSLISRVTKYKNVGNNVYVIFTQKTWF